MLALNDPTTRIGGGDTKVSDDQAIKVPDLFYASNEEILSFIEEQRDQKTSRARAQDLRRLGITIAHLAQEWLTERYES
jgi:hypothetical protein